jgi:hypothetical protein
MPANHSPRPNKQRPEFTNPFFVPATRSTRSGSSSSASSVASMGQPPSLAEILAQSYSTTGRNASLTSFGSSRRPSCFSILEAEEERAEFGDKCINVLEPRNNVGWWGVKEVLEEGECHRRMSES